MADLKRLYAKTGGFMKGICHPDGDRDGLLELGLRWVRRDIPFPFDSDGNETVHFAAYRKACEFYAEKGIYTVGITPYPAAFIAAGINVRTKDGLEKAGEVCRKIGVKYIINAKCLCRRNHSLFGCNSLVHTKRICPSRANRRSNLHNGNSFAVFNSIKYTVGIISCGERARWTVGNTLTAEGTSCLGNAKTVAHGNLGVCAAAVYFPNGKSLNLIANLYATHTGDAL